MISMATELSPRQQRVNTFQNTSFELLLQYIYIYKKYIYFVLNINFLNSDRPPKRSGTS